ncbi:alpha/beta fold hydrolase [Caballeronia sp. GAWG1-1]|uniref:alpha/beta hydrolase family protein n=1 Tax=Caballeronia sp. GAWG1-1 TaxID=2921742 RepID=UPI002028DFD4|nr:alpha/beta fold hydrolase [Caballeronia sp. GAWG1-1]
MRLSALVFVALAAVSVARADEPESLAADLHETVVQVPMIEKGLFGDSRRELVATLYQPDGAGPFPLIVLSHGSPPDPLNRVKTGRYRLIPQIRTFVEMGFAVIVPIRRGYGATGGTYAESTGKCATADYEASGNAAAQDILATIAYAKTQPQVDGNRIVLAGQSAGGFSSLAAASFDPHGVIAVLNFSGGRGGDPARHPTVPCAPDNMLRAITHFAGTVRVPVLWHYVENDQYFGPDYTRSWFNAFQQAGGQGQFVMEPPYGENGHGMFASRAAIPIWLPYVRNFLAPVIQMR